MEWRDFSYLIFSSSHACLKFPLFSLSFSISLSVFSLSLFSPWKCLEVRKRSWEYRQVVQNPWGTFSVSLLSFQCIPFTTPHPHPPLYYPTVWQAGPCWISQFYLHCASGWHCVLELGCSQNCVRAHAFMRVCVCVSLLEIIIMFKFMNLKLAWLYLPQSATCKLYPSWCQKKVSCQTVLYWDLKGG